MDFYNPDSHQFLRCLVHTNLLGNRYSRGILRRWVRDARVVMRAGDQNL